MLRNDLAALNTRVTNAINGGDLAAPYTLNVLNTPYVDSIVGTSELTKTSATITSFVTTGRGAQNAYIQRLYSTPIKINGTKYKITFSGGCYASWPGYDNNNTHANNFRVCVLDASTNALLLQSAGSPLSLSNLNGKNIKIAFRTDTPTTERWNRTMNMNSCIIGNT